jgi:hypothetical protein
LLYGLLAEFENPKAAIEAAEKVRGAGYRRTDAFSPFPVEGLHEALGGKKTILPWLVFGAGLSGGVGGFLMQWFASVIHYPMIVGGKPFNSWPAFIPITFELTILFAAGTAVIGMILLNGLPMPYHPVFHVPRFEQASQDRFFILIESKDVRFKLEETRKFLGGLGAAGVYEVPT